MQLERALADLMQKVERRVYGKYRGFVVDNEDPKKLGRLKLSVPSVLGTDVVTGWAMPCTPYGGGANHGMLFIPEVDSGVWVEFEEGDLEFPIWVGAFWSQPESEAEAPLPNAADGAQLDAAAEPMVTRKIIKTLKGHTIQFEDKDGEEMITIVHKVDQDNHNVITLDAAGIAISDFNGNTLTMTDSGVTIKDLSNNEIAMSDSAFNITSKVAFTLDAGGQAVEIKAKSIDLTKS